MLDLTWDNIIFFVLKVIENYKQSFQNITFPRTSKVISYFRYFSYRPLSLSLSHHAPAGKISLSKGGENTVYLHGDCNIVSCRERHHLYQIDLTNLPVSDCTFWSTWTHSLTYEWEFIQCVVCCCRKVPPLRVDPHRMPRLYPTVLWVSESPFVRFYFFFHSRTHRQLSSMFSVVGVVRVRA